MARLRTALIVFAAWTLVALFFSAQHSLGRAWLNAPPEPFGRVFSVYFICAVTWFLFTPAIVRLSRRYRITSPNVIPSAAVHVIASFLFALVSLAVFAAVAPASIKPPGMTFARHFVALLALELHLDLIRYWAVIAIEHAITFSRLRAELAEARLEVLKRQLHPHFLFNTLNSISVLMFEDVKVANRMLLRLSELLRAGLTGDSPHEVSLDHELRFLERYLDIERMRFGDRLTVDVSAEPSTLTARVPNLILQPLVENAIRYGVAAVDRPSRVSIRARKEGDELRLEVRDDGPGMKSTAKRGVGLSNTEARLRQLYGGEQRFELESPGDGGVRIRIAIPYRVATA
ncbi:MAG TPA: histidine kinase [Thermoanaerobaculia bacterium]